MILNALPEPDLDHALELAAEYLPDLDQDAFVRMYKGYPDLYIGCYEQDTLIGVCFGFPFAEVRSNEAGKMLLQGIAVRQEWAASGRGSRLLAFFEQQVRRRGHWTITLGSASGYVELFYMKNGFIPVSYRVEIPRDRLPQNDGNTGYEVAGRVMLGDATILYLKVTEYNPADKEVIKRLFDTDDVLYIFEKDV